MSEMSVVARFDGANDADGGNIAAGKGAFVHHLFDARAAGGDFTGEICETAWPIADDCSESAETAISDEPALDHAAQHVWIDVAAGKEQDGAFACEFVKLARETRG